MLIPRLVMLERIGLIINGLALVIAAFGCFLIWVFASASEYEGVVIMIILTTLFFAIIRAVGWLFSGY